MLRISKYRNFKISKFAFALAVLFCILTLTLVSLKKINAADSPSGADTTENTCGQDQQQKMQSGRPLEIVYPIIPGETILKTVNAGLPQYVSYIFHIAMIIIALIILGALIYSGLQYLTSMGNPEKFKSGRNTILYAAAGFAAVLLAKGVSVGIQSFLK